MVDKGGSSSNQGSSPQEKGCKNKRKSDCSQENPVNRVSSLIEFPPYELPSEKPQNPPLDPRPLNSVPAPPKPEVKEYQPENCGDPVQSQLEKLLFSNTLEVFQIAIKKIVQSGYSEDVAKKAIMIAGIYHGSADLLSNIVNETLAFLKEKKDAVSSLRDFVVQEFERLVGYTMLEMVNVLMEAKPTLSYTEAMWWLLMCDLNIAQACKVEDLSNLSNEFSGKEVSGESSSAPTVSSSQLVAKSSEPSLQKINEPDKPKCSHHNAQSNLSEKLKFGYVPNLSCPKGPLDPSGNAPTTSHRSSSSEEKLKTGHKVQKKKEYAALQKSLTMDRYLRHYSKSTTKSVKCTAIGSLILEKRVKSTSELPVVHMKDSASKTKGKLEVPLTSGSHCVSVDIQSAIDGSSKSDKKATGSPSTVSNVKNALSGSISAASNTKNAVSAEKKPPPEPEPRLLKISDYYAGIPYDKAQRNYVPADRRDKVILQMVPRLQKLQNELQSWTDWANKKVSQATQRLSIDNVELKALRQEKEEAEKFKGEKTMLEENNLKRLSDMEVTLNNTTAQVENTYSIVEKLELEKSLLRFDLEAAKIQATQSAANYKQALERDQKAMKDSHSWEKQKVLLQEELETEKRKVAKLQEEVDKAKDRQNQIEARWKQERMEKEKLLAQAATIRREKEQLEDASGRKEETMRQKAENNVKRCEKHVKRLENEISELKLKSDAFGIAALMRCLDRNYGTIGSKNANMTSEGKVENSQKNTGNGGVRRERECAMCLQEERSVVFLPCAHEVVCSECNKEHEKQGMKDCPWCRTPIQRRIQACFACP